MRLALWAIGGGIRRTGRSAWAGLNAGDAGKTNDETSADIAGELGRKLPAVQFNDLAGDVQADTESRTVILDVSAVIAVKNVLAVARRDA